MRKILIAAMLFRLINKRQAYNYYPYQQRKLFLAIRMSQLFYCFVSDTIFDAGMKNR